MENLTGQTSIVLPSHNPQFDGPRVLAILAVFIAHSEFNLDLPPGNVLQYSRIGVGLFFIFFCFLIAGILLDGEGSLSYFRSSYVRGALSEIAARTARHEFSIRFPGETT